MTGVSYNKLFNTRIRHGFYESGNGKNDLVVTPTIPTEQAMKNANMLFKLDNEGFRIFYKMDAAGTNPFVPINNTRLLFSLQLHDVGFLNYTALNKGLNPYASGKVIYFSNKGSETNPVLSYDLLDQLRPSVFTYQFPDQVTAGTGHLLIKNESNVDVTPALPDPNAIMPDAAKRYFYPIDFSKLPAGLYTFQTWVNSETPKTQTVYISDELAAKGVFGIVDIAVLNQSSFPPTDRAYDMQFVARTSQWKYYVVLQSGSHTSGEAIGIKDEGGDQLPYHELIFGAASSGTVNGKPAKIISSDRLDIPFFEVPKRKLTVIKDPGPSYTKIAENISGPSTNLVSAPSGTPGITEIFVYI